MLARSIRDDVESRAGTVPGLGLLPATVTFGAAKTLSRPSGTALGEPVAGYEIHHGTVTADGGDPFLDGCEAGSVRGTTWHGIFENDAFRRAFLRDLAVRAGRDFAPAPGVSFAAVRERRYDVLADLIAAHLDTGALSALIEGGVPAGLPTVVSGLARVSPLPQAAPDLRSYDREFLVRRVEEAEQGGEDLLVAVGRDAVEAPGGEHL
jgi:adenosylcobyric acid synthase